MCLEFKKEPYPLEVEALTVAYGSNPPILQNISFYVKKGEIVGILGGSGSGKSSLLYHIIGLARPREGRVLIFGQDLWENNGQYINQRRRQFGMMYQSGALFGSMNLLDNVSMPLKEFTELDPDIIETIAKLKLALVGLAGFEYYSPAEISGGMQKRAALARALALDPKLIFLDEPSAGLDPITSFEIDKLIMTLAKNLGISFVVVTHELGSIFTMVNRAVMLDKKVKGIIAIGSPDELSERHDLPGVVSFFKCREE